MNSSNSTVISYYFAAILVSVILSGIIILKLDWPAAAEIPLCISIWIQMAAFTKSVLNMLQTADIESIPEAFSVLKTGVYESDTGK